ncbi:MAG: hypothetical protein WCG66_11340 [bacterium]
MNTPEPNDVLKLYDRLAALIEKLPGGLQKPILRELTPIREMFLEQRAPRLLLSGGSQQSVPSLLAAMGASNIHCGESQRGWRSYQGGLAGATVRILDARNDAPDARCDTGPAGSSPDIELFLHDGDAPAAEWQKSIQRAAASGAPIIAVASSGELAGTLGEMLEGAQELRGKIRAVCSIDDPAFLEILCASLPAQAQLEFARLTNARKAQAFIASSLLRSFSAVCGVIGLQPMPLADLPILSTLQSLMVGLIIHTTGRPVTVKLVGEFLGALGFSIGAGFVFREVARASIRFVPIWGNAVSGFVAGAGTYAIGRAAIAYFVDDSPIQETRRIFLSMLPKSRSATKLP